MERSKTSLAKLGSKNPMYGKTLTEEHREKIARGIRDHYIKHPERRKLKARFGSKNPHWVGDKISYAGLHDWIEREKGKAANLSCKHKDGTCKGKLEWSNVSQKYLRKLYDWQVLCQSHHRRYDDPLHTHGRKTRFKKGHIPWNKGMRKHDS